MDNGGEFLLGYIKSYKPDLKVKDYEIYKGIYCSLCKRLGKSYSPIAQLLLNYDYTFLLLLKLSISSSCPSFKIKRCHYNPLVKCKTCSGKNNDLDFCSDTAVIMSYYKVKDNIVDSRIIKKIAMCFSFPFIALMHWKAKRRLPEVEKIVCQAMKEQRAIEMNKECGIDIAADPTAKALSSIFIAGENDEQRITILRRLGYLIGRWIYIIDAVDDLNDDLKNNNFNPFYITEKYNEEFCEYARQLLNTTAGEAALAFELLDIYRFKPILENIIYDGLANETERVLKKDRRCDREKSV